VTERDISQVRKRKDFENELIKKLSAKRFLKIFIKVNDVSISALRYAIIVLTVRKCKV